MSNLGQIEEGMKNLIAENEQLVETTKVLDREVIDQAIEIGRLRAALQEIAWDTCNPTNEPHVYAVRAREALAAVED